MVNHLHGDLSFLCVLSSSLTSKYMFTFAHYYSYMVYDLMFSLAKFSDRISKLISC